VYPDLGILRGVGSLVSGDLSVGLSFPNTICCHPLLKSVRTFSLSKVRKEGKTVAGDDDVAIDRRATENSVWTSDRC
jgi:hypothetical protein